MSQTYLNYKGEVKVKLYDKNKKLRSEKCYHNNGRWPLFKFISESLAANYTQAESYRPCYIGLYSIGYETHSSQAGDIPTIIETTRTETGSSKNEIQYYLKNNNSSILNSIGFKPYSSVKTTYTDNKVIGESSITYTFTIDSRLIELNQESSRENYSWDNSTDRKYTWNPVNMLCLYSKDFMPELTKNVTSLVDIPKRSNPAAYCFISDDDTTEHANILGNLITFDNFITKSSAYTLVIDWTLTFSNKVNE